MLIRNKTKVTSRTLMTIAIALIVTGERTRAETTSIGNGPFKVALVLSISADGPVGAMARSIQWC